MRFIVKIALLTFGLFLSTLVSAQSWSTQSSMKVKRSEAAAVEYKGELYVFNGFSQGLSVGTSVEKYNPSSKKWTKLGSTSVALGNGVTHTGTVIVGADVWLLGGRVGSHPGRVTSDVWIYNIPSKKWRKGPKLPVPMAAGGAAVVNNKIYIFGGVDTKAKCDVNHHYEYNLKSPGSGWKNITGAAAMPSARNHFSTVVLNGLIYAIGGQYGHDGCPGKQGGNTALVHTFNPNNKKWNRVANLPRKESHNEPSTFTHNGFIYSAGGNGAGTGAGNQVVRYDPSKNKWTQVATMPQRLVAPVARIYNGRLVVGGGGAPITAKSVVTVRSLGSSKFNDVAKGGTKAPTTPEPTPEPVVTKPEPTPEPVVTKPVVTEPVVTKPVVTKPVATKPVATDDVINISGTILSWPNDGWYQVQNAADFTEVCAGVRKCEVSSGTYTVINHSTGKRYEGIIVGNAKGSGSVDDVVVDGDTIKWPANGWYQVQKASNYKEVCAGGSSCKVSPGRYNVINHTSGIRYENIRVGEYASAMSFDDKVALFELNANDAASSALLDINHRFVTGTLSKQERSCIPSDLLGHSIVPVAGCDSATPLTNSGGAVSMFAFEEASMLGDFLTFEDDTANCRESLSNNETTACALSSVNLYKQGLHMQYGTSDQGEGSRSIIISDDALDVSGFVLSGGFGEDACFIEIGDNEQWSLLHDSDLASCESRLDQALLMLNE